MRPGDREPGDRAERFEASEQRLGDAPLPNRVPALRGRAVSHYLAGELRYACYLFESTLDELNRTGMHDPDALLLLYTGVIAPYMDMGAHARAAQAAEFALALAPQVGDPALVARMHRSVARTMIAEGRVAEADASLAKASELYLELQIRTELANCHWMRGYLYAQNGELERAESELREAQAMLSAKRAALYTSQVNVELADVLHRRGKSAEAAILLHEVLGDLSPSAAPCTRPARTACSASSPRTPGTRSPPRSTTSALKLSRAGGCGGGSRRSVPAPRGPVAPHGGWKWPSTPTARASATVRPPAPPPWAGPGPAPAVTVGPATAGGWGSAATSAPPKARRGRTGGLWGLPGLGQVYGLDSGVAHSRRAGNGGVENEYP